MKSSSLSASDIMTLWAMVKSNSSINVVEHPATGKKYAVKSVTDYVSAYLTQARTDNGEILVASNKPAVGLRSIDGTKLPEGTNRVVYGIRALFDTALVATSDTAIAAAAWANNAPVVFKNGEVRISQGVELFRSSGTDCTNFKASTGNDDDFRSVIPFVLRGGVETSINLKLSGTPTDHNAVKFEMRSVEFIETNRA